MKNAYDKTVIDLFCDQARKTPDRVAVVFDGDQLTYRELDEKSNQLAHCLIGKGVQRETLVGICLERSFEMIIGILGILKAGGAYVPIDPEYPADRIQYIISNTQLRHVIGCIPMQQKLEKVWSAFPEIAFISIEANSLALNNERISKVGVRVSANDLAYVIYTSGSTGKPKGVMNEHKGLFNRFIWGQHYFKLGHDDVFLQKTTYCFDVSITELLWPILFGAKIVFAKPGGQKDSHYIKQIIEEQNVTIIHFVPSMLEVFLLSCQVGDCKSLRKIMCSGEALTLHQVNKAQQTLPHADVFNLYGPTEAAIEVTCWKVPSAPHYVSIGTAIANTTLIIVDEEMRPINNDDAGELLIGGIQVARGYLNEPDLTAEKFILYEPETTEKQRFYRTGDRVKRRESGEIEYLGRLDNQVKIRGFRIELGEIEQTLLEFPSIAQCCVNVWDNEHMGKQLVAYLVTDESEVNEQELSLFLEKKLPLYMLPSHYVCLGNLPLSTNGKLDRKALPLPDRKKRQKKETSKSSITGIEKEIIAIWESLFGIKELDTDDNFFELGGNSILALKFAALLNEKHGYDVPVIQLYEFPTICQLSRFISTGKKKTLAFERKDKSGKHGDVAIIGMTGRFPGANTIDELWEVLVSGKETTKFFRDSELDPHIPLAERTNPNYVKARGVIDQPEWFDAELFGITPLMAKLMDPQQRVFLELCREILESTGHLPAVYDGSVGIYAGTGNATYFVNNLLSNRDEIEKIGSFQVMTANEKDYITTRVAYHLNLRGPAVSVYSACSTSLLAVAQAVQAIRDKQCDVAIAGGISITVPINSGHVYEEGAMLSKDGHCRPFDSNAQGTVFSDGAGIVLLKDLESAKKDGDNILAVIKGVGISNDGGNKGSFTAPSAEGQAYAIAAALADANTDASTISYVEAHGTATPLGDPIEIEGLKMAYGEQAKKQYCRIGSIKSNMGHLTHAAGVAGLIKTTLSLYHKVIPASINYTQDNPNIDFLNSPFKVNDSLTNWETNSIRRAGISSFGVGGTNVHIIVEEYNNIQKSEQVNSSDKPLTLIQWSARSHESLEKYANDLKVFASRHPNTPIHDIAYTLRKTREDFKWRAYTIAKDAKDLVKQLESKSWQTHNMSKQENGLVFMFPGQGSQYVGMGRELYQQEPIYTAAVDECASLLMPHLGEDIRSIIFSEEDSVIAAEKLRNTFYTQPALFVTEYALAKLWLAWGIRPTALIGHSIGEFVAAHLAGVFSLKDVLKLVSIRGQLISSLPSGSMLSVRSSVDRLIDQLPSGICVAAINAPNLCVVAGKTPLVTEFSARLEKQGIISKPLHTSHAFHSDMMDPILDEFREVVSNITLAIPKLPISSTVTGEWLKDSEAQDPAYWVNHVKATVNFSGALQFIDKAINPVFLEVGPGNVTSTLTKQHGSALASRTIGGLVAASNPFDEYRSVIDAIGKLWQQGIQTQWDERHQGIHHGLLTNLPTYAFSKKRYWIEPNTPASPHGYQEETSHRGISPMIEREETNKPTNQEETKKMRKASLINQVKDLLENASGIEIDDSVVAGNFIELGLDSLLLTQIAQTLKKEFGLPITFRQLNESYYNLELLAEYLDENLPPDPAAKHPAFTSNPPMAEFPTNQAISTPVVTSTTHSDAITLISQQISLLSQQVALLQSQQGPAKVVLPSATLIEQKNGFHKIAPKTESISEEDLKELKKPFGATARIEKQSADLSAAQETYLADFITKYVAKTPKSKSYTQKHRQYMADPRVVSGFKPITKEMTYALVVNKSDGCRVWDIDGNEYVDALNGFGSSMLGNQPEVIKQALLQQIEEGYEIGPQHEKAGDVCKLVSELTGLDRVGLCNTGSEAVLGAMRIARTVTGRSTIVAFTNSYHGIVDEVLVRGTKKLKTFPAASGIMPEAVQNMLILDYGTEESLQIIKERAHELAAILVEPVQSRRPEFLPVDFLKELRKISSQSGSALIFDEVISGFRFHPAGIQGLLGIQADIATYGKVAGAGISVGIIAGKKEFMDALDGGCWSYGDDSVPEAGVTYFAGTFVRHPLALATTKASLEYLKEQGPQLQENLNKRTDYLVHRLNDICERYQTPMYIAHFGSLWKIKYREEYPYSELLFAAMRLRGVHILDGFPCFLTTAHRDEDIDLIIHTFEESVHELVKADFIPTAENADTMTAPPVPHARLGRDAQGNAAWFVQDENNPGKYLQVVTS